MLITWKLSVSILYYDIYVIFFLTGSSLPYTGPIPSSVNMSKKYIYFHKPNLLLSKKFPWSYLKFHDFSRFTKFPDNSSFPSLWETCLIIL